MTDIVSLFKGKRILVVGDAMMDQYLFCQVERISPEAPVPIAQVTRETHVPGGAANVAQNIASLGGLAVLLAAVGEDETGRLLAADCKAGGLETYFITDSSRPTTRKTRVIGQHQQILRLDHERPGPLSASSANALRKKATELSSGCDIVIVSDYAKGVVDGELMASLRASGKKIIIDPKPRHASLYSSVFMLTPNLAEASAMLGRPLEQPPDWEEGARALASRFKSHVLLTLGGQGMLLASSDGTTRRFPSKAREVYDVSGAGDTVVAVLSLALAAGNDLASACQLANLAGGIKVGKFGTAAVSADELTKALAASEESHL